MDKLLDGTRNAWANMRVESLKVDGELDVDGAINLAPNIDIDARNITADQININAAGSLNFGAGVSVNGEPRIVTGLNFIAGSLNIGDTTFQDPVNFRSQINYTKKDDAAVTTRGFIDTGNLVDYVYTHNNDGANADMQVNIYDSAGIVVYSISYTGVALVGAQARASWSIPVAAPPPAVNPLVYARRKPLSIFQVPILIFGGANLERAYLSLATNGNITINLVDGNGAPKNFANGVVYSIPQKTTFTILREFP